MTEILKRKPVLAAFVVSELAFVIYFWPVFWRLGQNVYIFLDRHVADCVLTGCPKIPLW